MNRNVAVRCVLALMALAGSSANAAEPAAKSGKAAKAAEAKPAEAKAADPKSGAKPAGKAGAKAAANIFTDERDQETYKTAVFDGKTWMLEPLRHMPEGAKDLMYWGASADNKAKGLFYGRGLVEKAIPAGWRLPTETEVKALLAKIGPAPDALAKAGFAVEPLEFSLDDYKNALQYKNDEYMRSVLKLKPFRTPADEKFMWSEFLAVRELTSNNAEGKPIVTTFDASIHITAKETTSHPGVSPYPRLLLVKM